MNKTKKNARSKKTKNKTRRNKSSAVKKRSDGTLIFKDHPEFRPNLTPRDMFKLGSFGGTYWRPIYSSVVGKKLKNVHKKYPKSWWEGIPDDHLTRPFDEYDTKINKYGVKVGTTLEFWEEKDGSQNISHMVGFSGIVIFTLDVGHLMMKDRLIDG